MTSVAGQRRWLGVNLALGFSVILTAVAVINSSHQCRALYGHLQELQSSQWRMQENWGRLLLEESTWAAHHRVEQLANKQLGMRLPEAAELQVVLP